MYVLQMPDLNQELRETAHPHKQSLMESHLLLFYKKYNYHSPIDQYYHACL